MSDKFMFSKFILAFWLCFIRDVSEGKELEYSQEPLGNLMDISWKLPKDGGGGDTQCVKDILHMYSSLENMTLWAFQMWEATADKSSGWEQGSVYQFGNFDECLEEGFMRRQYCLATVNIARHPGHEPITKYLDTFTPTSSLYDIIYYTGDIAYLRRDVLHWGICSPASCSYDELQRLMQRHIDEQIMEKAYMMNNTNPKIVPKILISIPQDMCQQTNIPEPFGIGAQIFFWMTGIMVIIVALVSVYHCYLIHTNPDMAGKSGLVKAFSAIRHLKYLNKTSGSDGDKTSGMEVLWGIRVLSILIVMSGHVNGTRIASAIINRKFTEEEYHEISSIIISHGDTAVDSFFAMSGLLSMFAILKSQPRIQYYPVMILYRYIRIVTAYAVVIVLYAFVLPYTGSGPTWPQVMGKEGQYCRENWWLNLLMLNNYINVDGMCMTHSWYIPCDFHYFLIMLVVVTFFKKKSQNFTAISFLSILIIAAVLSPAIVTYIKRLPGTMLFLDDFLTNPRGHVYFQNVYIASHTRASPYFIGMLAGYLIHKYRKPDKKLFSTLLSSVVALLSLIVLLGILVSGTVFYEPNHAYSIMEATIYAALQRSVWATALCCLILCCVFGTVPFITSFLGWSAWVPLGKLVYGAYVVHMGFEIRTATLSRTPFYFSKFITLNQLLGDAVFAFLCSLFLFLVYEAPFKMVIGFLIKSCVKLPKTDTTKEDTYTPQGRDNKGMEMDAVQSGDVESNVIRKYDNNIHTKDNNVTCKL